MLARPTEELNLHRVAQELTHIGIRRRSGRYPWGSGDDPHQSSKDFKAYVDDLKSKGFTPTQICKTIEEFSGLPYSTADLRADTAISTEEIRRENISTARKLKEKKMSNIAIAEQMGTRESTVRGWLKETEDIKEGSLLAISNTLKQQVAEKPFLDVSKGNHLYMNVSFTKFNTAVAKLHGDGYEVHPVKIKQQGTDKYTDTKVLCKPGTPWKEARDAVYGGELRVIAAQSDDGGQSFRIPKNSPISVNSKRIAVRYSEDGGNKMDGVIELRRDIPDISLGSNRYAQVRVAVDGTHYLKGMAMYADDLPAGVDMRFNTNKSKTDPKILAEGKLGSMKPMKTKEDGEVDTDNPFGASVRPHMFLDKNGKEKQSPLNMVNEEGDWDKWSNALSSQMLSKQPISLAAAQLGKARTSREQELKTIMSLTNPVVKKKLLEEYADSADAAAVHLKAAKMDRQSNHVILPINSIRPNEIYAPNYNQGERVVLVRHPHGGPFEIPELVVNNNNRDAKRIISNARDAVAIHHTVAEQLSGADFDGDTVLVIPNDARKVKTRPPFEELKNFDPKVQYKISDDDTTTTRMTKKNTQTEMGKISNLITDMTIHGANDAEISRAVRHSMVVIDAEKHGLNYKQSEKDFNIISLKEKYQYPGGGKGAATIISRASSEGKVPQRKLRKAADGGPIDPKTGKLVFEDTGVTYVKTTPERVTKRGVVIPAKTEVVDKTTKGSRMEFVDDARELTSGGLKNSSPPMEHIYASYANEMKSLANLARKEGLKIKDPKMSAAAKAVYAKEVESLNAKLKLAQRNAPLERRAQAMAGAMAKSRIEAYPNADNDDIKKIRYQSLEEARRITGASKIKIGSDDSPLTDQEWKAIQSGAISSTVLREILSNANMTRVRELATPRTRTSLTPGQLARARQMEAQGRSLADIAAALGIPRTTIADNLGER